MDISAEPQFLESLITPESMQKIFDESDWSNFLIKDSTIVFKIIKEIQKE